MGNFLDRELAVLFPRRPQSLSGQDQGGENSAASPALGAERLLTREPGWHLLSPWRQPEVCLTVVCKYLAVSLGLSVLLVTTALNLLGLLNFNLAVYSGLFLSRIVLVLAIGISVFALRIALKALWCWAVSVWAARGYAVSYRTLIFLPLAWNDYDDAQELGYCLTALAMLISLIPVFVAVFTIRGYSVSVQYGAPVNVNRDIAGHGGCNGESVCLLASNMLLPNESQRLMSVDPADQPRYFCATTQRHGDEFLSTVYVPTFPYPVLEAMGNRGQRIAVRRLHGFLFNSICTSLDATPIHLPPDSALQERVSLLKGDFFAVGPRLAKDFQNLTYDLLYSFNGNTSCRATVQRAIMSATWVINATGHYVEYCSDVQPEPMGNYSAFTHNYRDADTWLNLTYRNTFRHVRGHLTRALLDGASTDYANIIRVRVSLIHVVAYLYATSREDDPAHRSSSFGGTISYTVWPINEYYTVSAAVFVLLVLTFAAFIISGASRMTPHGFHGGSITQLFYLCRNLDCLEGWAADLFHPNPARVSTQLMLQLSPDGDAFEVFDKELTGKAEVPMVL